MKKIIVATIVLVAVVFQVANAQQPATDSAELIKKQVKITKLTNDIAEQKDQLARTEAALQEAQAKNSAAEERAADAAADNAKLAEKLQNDPTDKRLSRKARKAAKNAKNKARSGRRADSSVSSYTDKAEKLRKSIARDEKKLAELQTGQ